MLCLSSLAYDMFYIYFMCNLLMHPGHTVTFAENGADALEMMTAQYIVQDSSVAAVKFDVVLMDLQMPIMDGLESTARLRQFEMDLNSANGSDVRQFILGLSANSDTDTMNAAFKAGIDAFIPKPFNVESFKDKYRNWLNKVKQNSLRI